MTQKEELHRSQSGREGDDNRKEGEDSFGGKKKKRMHSGTLHNHRSYLAQMAQTAASFSS